MKKWILVISGTLLLFSCKQKEDTPDVTTDYFPVQAFIKSQVAQVDTGLYSIMKLTYVDSTRTDTEYVKREQFRALAKDFLDLPDLSDKKISKRFIEEKQFDQTLQRVIVRYTPRDPKKEEIQKEEVLIMPGTPTGDRINNIIIEKIVSNRDGYLQQNLLWQADKSFQVITITQKPGGEENTSRVKVSWNEDKE